MRMHTPSRPGDMVGDMVEELEITVTAAAEALHVSRQTLNNLINNTNASVSPEMALRLEAVFGSTAENWLRMQANYDAAQIREKASEIQAGLKKIQPAAA